MSSEVSDTSHFTPHTQFHNHTHYGAYAYHTSEIGFSAGSPEVNDTGAVRAKIKLHEDNRAAMCIFASPQPALNAKSHVQLRFYVVVVVQEERLEQYKVDVTYVSTKHMLADTLTKATGGRPFTAHRKVLLNPPPTDRPPWWSVFGCDFATCRLQPIARKRVFRTHQVVYFSGLDRRRASRFGSRDI